MSVKTKLFTAAVALILSTLAHATGPWLTDYDAAVAIAKKQNKPLLVEFTGSDWCHWCKVLDREVLSQRSFISKAKKDYVLVKIDFPQSNPLPAAQAQKNEALAKKFRVRGFPTVLVLSPKGKEIQRTGYQEGGAKSYLQHLKRS